MPGSRRDPRTILHGDEVECPECGRRWINLANHLRQGHGIDPADYRAERGLPPNAPIGSPVLSQHLASVHHDELGEQDADDDPWLDTKRAAAAAGVTVVTWRDWRARGWVPEPEATVPHSGRERPVWRASTVARAVHDARAAALRGDLQALARRRHQAEVARAEAMAETADLLRTGQTFGVPVAHLADWSGLTRQTVYDILGRDAAC